MMFYKTIKYLKPLLFFGCTLTPACQSGGSGDSSSPNHLYDASQAGAAGQTQDADSDANQEPVDYGGPQPIPGLIAINENDGLPDCGPGCRIALKRPVVHAAWGHGFSEQWLADTNPNELVFAKVGSNETWVVPQPAAFAHVNGEQIAYIGFDAWPKGEIAVINAAQQTKQIYFTFDDTKELGLVDLYLTDKHVIWSGDKGLFKANLKTGAISQLSQQRLDCREGCTAQGAIYCVSNITGRVDRIDEETGELTHLDDGGALQVEGGCSPDKKKIVWVDHRPPAQPSSYHGFRGPGEIYLHDIPSGKTERLTFDSPTKGIAKTGAAVGSDWVTWFEPCAECEQTFQTAGGLYRAAKRYVRLDLNTRKKCYLEGMKAGAYATLHGHHFYAYWNDGKDMFVVDVDLDHPDLDWQCEETARP